MKKEDVKKGFLTSSFSPAARKVILAVVSTIALATGMGMSQQAEAGIWDTIKAATGNEVERQGAEAGQQVINGIFKGVGLGSQSECVNRANQQVTRDTRGKTQAWTQYYKQCEDTKAQYRQRAQAQAEYQRVQSASQNLTTDYNRCAQDRRAEKPTTNYCSNVIYRVEGKDGMIILPGGNISTVSAVMSPGPR